MNNTLKLGLAALACVVLVAAAWWLHVPSPFPEKALTETLSNPFEAFSENEDLSDDTLSKRIAALDPFGLSRNVPLAAAPTIPSVPSETIEWRLAALVVRPSERYLILSARDQSPLQIAEGGKLPNGDRVKSIGTHQAVLQSPQGRTRTIYLTEP